MAIGIIVAVLLILLICLSFFFANFSMSIRRQTLEEARSWQESHYDLSWYDPMEKEDYTVTSYDGYVSISAKMRSAPASANRIELNCCEIWEMRLDTCRTNCSDATSALPSTSKLWWFAKNVPSMMKSSPGTGAASSTPTVQVMA